MWNSLFTQTFDHVGPFSIGLVTGYVVAKHKDRLIFSPVSKLFNVSIIFIALFLNNNLLNYLYTKVTCFIETSKFQKRKIFNKFDPYFALGKLQYYFFQDNQIIK